MKKINLNDKQRRGIVIGIALIFLLMAFLRRVYGIGLEGKTLETVEFVLMVLAFSILFGRKKRNGDSKEEIDQNTVDNQDK